MPKWGTPWCFYSLFDPGMVEDRIPRSKGLLSHAKAAFVVTGQLQGWPGLRRERSSSLFYRAAAYVKRRCSL